jgi:protein-S-isoprenylcysteine O-methyltransferase Ste14
VNVTEPQLFRAAILLLFLVAGAVFFILGRVSAPYGRHQRKGWGPTMPRRLGWIVMESPCWFLFAAVFLMGPRADLWVPRILAVLWLVHYVHRGLIYPLVNHRPGKTIPVAVVAIALVFNVLNAYVNSRSLSALGPTYELGWLLSFRFLYGLLLFVTGFVINRWSDRTLARLARSSDDGYQIPRGGLFEEVSCPNYLGEVVQWAGWAFMTWSQAGLVFAVFTAANLVPRAVSHHNWYRRKFPAYPRRRRAIIPYVL